MDSNVQDICRVCRSEGSTEKPMYHPCICTGNIATIKRKPSFTPKIPLTSTTRNLAKQSDNALLDIKLSSGDDEKLLRNGTLRLKRPSTHERLNSINVKESTTATPQVQSNNNHQPISPKADEMNCLRRRSNNDFVEDDDLDDYPLPPPPETLTSSLSCLSLNSLPPPPSEFLDESAINNGCSIDYHDDDFNTTYIQRPTSITSSKSSVGSSQSPSRRHSNAKPIASPVVPPKPHGLSSNGRIYESINPVNNNMNNNNNYNYDDTRSTNDTISISSCDSNSTSNISSVGTSSSDSNISNRYQMIRISNPPTEMITKNTSESQISLSSSSSSIHQNNIQQPMTAQSIVTTPQSKSEYQFQPHPVRNNESNYHERTDEPIYQQIPAYIETNQPNIIYHQPQSQKSQINKPQQQPFIQHPHNYQSQSQHQQLQTLHYQLPTNHSNYNQKQDSLDGPIYQEVPKNLVHHQNIYGINTINGNNMSINSNNINITNNNRESTISQCSSIGSNSSHSSNNSSPVIIANNNNHNPLNLESRSSNITSNQTRNNNNSNNNSIINNVNECKMSTFNNKREIAASFNYPVPTRSPMRGPLPPPPEVFLRDIHRVMDKKWKVSQQLTLDSSQSVNQLISGYRDPYDQMIQMIQMNEILCLDELLNQQKSSPTPAYQQPQPQPQQQYPPKPSNHYETPPSLNQNHHYYHQHQQQIKLIQHQQQQQNYDNHYQSQHVSPSCQQIDELPEYDHNHLTKYTNNNQSNQTTNLIISSTQSCNYNGANGQQQQANQDIPVPPPPPVLRCTNSSLFDKPLSRNKNGPPPPPRRSDKTRLSGRYQMRIETPNKPNQQ